MKRLLTAFLLSASMILAPNAALWAATSNLPVKKTASAFSRIGGVSFHAGYGQLPLVFEANAGQTDSQVRMIARGVGYTLFLTDSETVLSLDRYDNRPPTKIESARGLKKVPRLLGADVLRLSLAGVNPGVTFETQNPLPGVSSYFIGKDSSHWKTGLKQYAQATAHDVYPGIDMVYYGTRGQLEYDFHVKPGVDPKVIRIRHAGAEGTALDDQGNLRLTIGDRSMSFKAPVMYQEEGGVRTTVEGKYVLSGTHEMGFEAGDYDKTKTLIIDPALDYSTYLSGTNGATGDYGSGIVVDSLGSAYLTGRASSTNFPTTTGAYQTVNHDNSNVFITKMSADGSSLVYSTYLGGTGIDFGTAIVLDSGKNAYITGAAGSTDFPTTASAYQTANVKTVAFLSEISADGKSLLYSTYLGGSGGDQGNGIAMDTSGHPYLTGFTNSADFPTTSKAFQTVNNAAGDAGDNAFLAKFNPVGGGKSDLLYSTYLGGSGYDNGTGIAVDSSGNAYLGGTTGDSNFPTTPKAYQTGQSGISSSFMTEISPLGNGTADMVYSTYFDATNGIQVTAIALDSNRNVYLTGDTSSTDFPITSGAYQKTWAGTIASAFVTEINPGGNGPADLIYSSYLGGSNHDQGNGIALDSNDNIYVTGFTQSSNFPTTSGAYQKALGAVGVKNGFISMFNPGAGTVGLVYSSYLGGATGDVANAIALDPAGNAYITGLADSTNFPTTGSAFQTTQKDSNGSGFVAKFDVSDFPQFTLTPTPTGSATPTVTSTATITPSTTPGVVLTNTFTITPSTTPGAVLTSTMTNSPSATPGVVLTNTSTITPSTTPGVVLTNTFTITPSATPGVALTNTLTNTPSTTPGVILTNTSTISPSTTPGVILTNTFTNTPSTTPGVVLTNTSTISPSTTPGVILTNTFTITPSATPGVALTNTLTNTPSTTPGLVLTNTPTITPSTTDVIVATSTATITPSATNRATVTHTPTSTVTGTITMSPTPGAPPGTPVLGPVPVLGGGTLCLYPDKPIQSCQWDVYDWIGASIASLNFNGNNACWNVSGVPPGIYIVRIKVIYRDGDTGTTWQKIVVAR